VSAPPDPSEDVLTRQRDAWTAVADGWRRWWPTFERAAQGVNERLVELAGVGPGQRVLDFATGIGEPALTAARAVGPGGAVLGFDLAADMVRHARERAAEAGLDQATFAVGDAHALELEDASFDAALARWGLMLMVDPGRVLEVVGRALRPGGRLAAAVWAEPERVPFLALPTTALRRALGVEPPPEDEPGPFGLAGPDDAPALLRAAGFADVRSEEVEVEFRFDSLERFHAFLTDLSSTTRSLLAERTEAERERARAAVFEALAPFVEPGGAVRMANLSRCVVGTRRA